MKIALLLFSALLFISCGSRLPAPQTSQKVLTKWFQKYGKKHKESDFGRYRLDHIEISEIREIQKNLAEVEAYTFLKDGGPLYWVRVTLQKKPFGWRYLAWENLGKK